MSRKTGRNGFIFVAAMCIGLMVMSVRGGSLDSPAAPVADPGSNWSFAVFGDTRGNGTNTPSAPILNTPVIQAICAAITNDGVLCAIVPGDMVIGQEDGVTNTLDYQLALWTNAVSALNRAGIPYYAVRGNHEIHSVDETNRPAHADWTKHIGRYMPTNGPAGEIGMTYSIPYGNALFIGLDTDNGTNDDFEYHAINQDWLDVQLAANTRPHLFVFGHEPAFQADAYDPCLSANLPQRNRFWDSIGTANARAYLTGHSHIYGRCLASISNGPTLRQIIVGTGGAPLVNWDGQYIEPAGSGALIVPEIDYTPANTYGYTLVHVSGNHVVMEYKSTTNLTTWTTNDVFAYTIIATPTNIHASDGNPGNVLVSWDADDDASGYEVWRGTTNAPAAGRARIGVTANTSFSDTNAVPAMYYYYWVRATNTFGASLFSAFDTGWRAGAFADFDGDGKADPAAYQGGQMIVAFSGSDYELHGVALGGPGGIECSADFDGDGKTDPAVYNPTTSRLSVLFSTRSYTLGGMSMGGAGCVPVVGDFDGDGKADPTLYNAASRLLVAWLSSLDYSNPRGASLGGAGWLNASADYDGDGKTDPAVYEPASGTWQALLSSHGYSSYGWTTAGGAGAVPVPGDYDGDGKADLMVYQPAGGLWLCAYSGQNYTTTGSITGFGGPTMAARAGDYDGDHKADLAVYDPVTRTFYAMLSGSGYRLFGMSL